MNAHTVNLHVLRPSAIDPLTFARLDASEEQRAASFRFPADAHRWAACRVALKSILALELGTLPQSIHLQHLPLGKPVLPPPHSHLHFNLSHCEDLALIATSYDSPLGVDVEPLSRASDLLGCESSFCHPLEMADMLKNPSEFASSLLKIWTCKEALLKHSGDGLNHPPADVHLTLHPDHATVAETSPLFSKDQRIEILNHPFLHGHQAALCCSIPTSNIRFINPFQSID